VSARTAADAARDPRAVASVAAVGMQTGADVPSHPAVPAIRVTGVAAGYGSTTVLAGLDLEVARGELVGLVGPSGCGKTSVLKLLTGRLQLHTGVVEVLGRRVGRRSPGGVGYVPQLGSVDLDFPLTVEQVVLLGDAASSGLRPWFSRRERAAARTLLDRLGLAGLHDRQLRELSGGQLQRTFLARALQRRCELLLLDEPTSGVDLATRRDVLATVHALHADGLTVVVTTHDLNLVATHLPRIVCLHGGVVADGTPAEVLTPSVLEATYGAPMHVIRDGGRIVVVDDELPAAAPLGLVPGEPLARELRAVDVVDLDEGTVA
jgi:zinc/manganese transport system ATP-binding protein